VKIILTDETERLMATGSPDTDGELWDRLRHGDQQALGELFDRYADDVHAFAFRRTASWAAAVVTNGFAFTATSAMIPHSKEPADGSDPNHGHEELRAFDSLGNPVPLQY
jgi:hypothetical protein